MNYFEVSVCTNCKANCWRLGEHKEGMTEFACVPCGHRLFWPQTRAEFARMREGR